MNERHARRFPVSKRARCLAGGILWLCTMADSPTAPIQDLPPMNALVLKQIATMPAGGGYATDLEAHTKLASAVRGNRVSPPADSPSYCSGATYLVFLKVLAALEKTGSVNLTAEDWQALAPRLRADGRDTLPDGEGIWGRWNANGPGTARLFKLLGLGCNFTGLSEARPGDFLKIFWTGAVGKNERGHLVVFLGLEETSEGKSLRFWSSNQPDGYGEKTVPLSKVAATIFSRLEHPSRITRWRDLPPLDPYLSKLLTTESSLPEALKRCGIVRK